MVIVHKSRRRAVWTADSDRCHLGRLGESHLTTDLGRAGGELATKAAADPAKRSGRCAEHERAVLVDGDQVDWLKPDLERALSN